MIIVLSGWRGLPKTAARRAREQSQARIDEACAEVADHLLRSINTITIRYGDCPSGVDDAFHRLFRDPRIKRRMDRVNSRAVRFEADWSLPNYSGGPVRNNAMLDGDGSLDLHEGIAHQLIALPEPGKRKLHSGTWGCVDAAMERLVPVHLVHLGVRDVYTVAGLRRTRMPLITPLEKLTISLVAAR